MPDVIAEFVAWYEPYHDISPERARARLSALLRLDEFLGERPITELQARDLEAWLMSLKFKPRTVLKYLSLVRPFIKWMGKHRLISAEQYLDLQDVQAPRGAAHSNPRPYSREEIREFWFYFEQRFPYTDDVDKRDRTPEQAELYVRKWLEYRLDWHWKRVRMYARRLQGEAIVALALFGGLRRVEIYNLTLEDMHYENDHVLVHGARKNVERVSYDRAVPMVEPIRVAIGNWLEFRKQVMMPDHERPWLALYGNRKNQPMGFSTFAHLMGEIGERYELHRMRHTFATERLRAGMPAATLQAALGHANISQTLEYAQIDNEDVIRVADETNDQFVSAVSRKAA